MGIAGQGHSSSWEPLQLLLPMYVLCFGHRIGEIVFELIPTVKLFQDFYL